MTEIVNHPGRFICEPLPGRFVEYRDRHRGASIVVCGCGTSLALLEHPERYLTIGVNDIGRRFTPDYLVVVNERRQFERERYRHVELTQAKAVFTQLTRLDLQQTRVVCFRLGRRGGTERTDVDTLHYSNNSPYVAVNLARHLGAKRIGLIGVDFTDDHFFGATGRHPLTSQLPQIDREYAALAEACRAEGVELVNLSPISRLQSLPRATLADWEARETMRVRDPVATEALKIVSYATTPVAGVPAILARCISAATPHNARCVWARNDYGNGVVFEGDVEWTRTPAEAEHLIETADLVIVHNGKAEYRHQRLLAGKPIITMAHNYIWNVESGFVDMGFPGVVVGQYQATLPEFAKWSIVPNPLPLWEAAYRPELKPDVVTIAYTPSGRHDSYPMGHRLYWHGKGYHATMTVLDALARRYPINVVATRDRQISHCEALAAKRRAHVVIDECVTGSYHRNSLEGLACGCIVVNGVERRGGVAAVLSRCARGARDMPFVRARLDTLQAVLSLLIESDSAALDSTGRRSRAWMENHWDFAGQWDFFWRPQVEKAIAISRRNQMAPLPPRSRTPALAPPATDFAVPPGGSERRPLPLVGRDPTYTKQEGPAMMQRAIDDVSVIVPHGGADRLPLLAVTLATLRQRPGIGEIIVVELGTIPLAKEIAGRWASKHLFVKHAGAFERARALNAGEAVTDRELLLWHDNDLIIPLEFVPRAVAELRDRRLDFLIPYTAINYLSESDSAAVIAGVRNPNDCRPANTFYSGRRLAGSFGAMGLVRREFLNRHGGLIEGFRGWGGEDNAWNHKVSLCGRAAPTERRDQKLHHLFHEGSGGYRPGRAGPANPHYADNVALLSRILSVRTASEFARHFPPTKPAVGFLTCYSAPATAPAVRGIEDDSPSPYERIFSSHAEQYRRSRSESLSGPGSSLNQTKELRERLPLVLQALGVRSLLDAPCGDLNWMQHVRLPVQRYIGVDILRDVIAENERRHASTQRSFMRADLTRQPLPMADAILCRDLLTHLSFAEIFAVLANFKRSGATYLLTTTFIKDRPNRESSGGEWRSINLTAPPFNFPRAKTIINENCTEGGGSFADKSLGAWNLSELPLSAELPSALPKVATRREHTLSAAAAGILTYPVPAVAGRNVLPVWTYWEGPCPDWILACGRTIAAFAPRLIPLTPESFDRLWDRDRDISLSRLHAPHRADFVRAFLLRRFGGMWLDADCLVMQPLQPVLDLLDEHDFVGHRERAGLISNAFIAARQGSRIAAAFYERVCAKLRSRRQLGWNEIGADSLSALVAADSRGWHELPCERVQPICWSQPEKFFEAREAEGHEREFDPRAICYMLSNGAIKNYQTRHPGSELMNAASFFSFLLGRALRGIKDDSPSPYERIFSSRAEQYRRSRSESLSGPGSSLNQTKELRERLPLVLQALGVRSLLDAPCGDLNWMQHVRLPVQRYIGVDILRDVIAENEWRYTSMQRSFMRADLTSQPLPRADAILCRDLLTHLSFAEIFAVLANFKRSGASYLLTTTFTEDRPNRESSGGEWRTINLTALPFNFPRAKTIINENCTEGGGSFADKSLGVWNVSELPAEFPSEHLKVASITKVPEVLPS